MTLHTNYSMIIILLEFYEQHTCHHIASFILDNEMIIVRCSLAIDHW